MVSLSSLSGREHPNRSLVGEEWFSEVGLPLYGVLRRLGLWGYRKSRVRQSGWGPSFAGLRPLGWLARWSTTREGVCGEQEHAYHGYSRGGDNRSGSLPTLAATSIMVAGATIGGMVSAPSLRSPKSPWISSERKPL